MAWLPALKALLPYATQIVTAAIPAFTKKADRGKTEDVVPQQIQELQTAVTHNAESLKLLATQLQQVITGLESGAAKIDNEIRAIKRLCLGAVALSILALALCAVLWLR
jgi:hypothetical protein